MIQVSVFQPRLTHLRRPQSAQVSDLVFQISGQDLVMLVSAGLLAALPEVRATEKLLVSEQ